MIKLFQQGYKVTVTRRGQALGRFRSCFSHLWCAIKEAEWILRDEPGAVEARVYSYNRVDRHYGLFVVAHLIKINQMPNGAFDLVDRKQEPRGKTTTSK